LEYFPLWIISSNSLIFSYKNLVIS
jgi:hypothetical protein